MSTHMSTQDRAGKLRGAIALAAVFAAGVGGGVWYARLPAAPAPVATVQTAAATERAILYYRDPSGVPRWSATPATDAQGRAFLPVYDDEEISFDPQAPPPPPKPKAAGGPRKILYYRNPMGLPDTSPVPKKDSMGMDYIAVYEGEDSDDGTTVKVSLDKVQRSGVRTEKVGPRAVVRPVRAVGIVKHDEARQTVVTLRAEGYIEELFVSRTGQHVRAGEPLFRLYSKDIQIAQSDLIVAAGVKGTSLQGMSAQSVQGSIQRLRNLEVPESRIEEVRTTGLNPRTIDWPSPATGDVIEKRIVKGQRVMPGDELYRITDHSHLWIIADVAEADLAMINVGTPATVTVRAYPTQPVEGDVTFIYPELKAETRTARVRIEVPNQDGRLKIDMYADVVFRTGAGRESVVAVPDSAVIDSGARQVVLVAKGEGRFEPRAVRLGRRGDGYVEVLEGVTPGEEVVTSATFLIDAESNLRAALKSFAQGEGMKAEASK
jgi:Cu(I)/Ag(I) efflux system membrane fusion protein